MLREFPIKKANKQKFGLYQNFIYVCKVIAKSTIEKWLRKNSYIE